MALLCPERERSCVSGGFRLSLDATPRSVVPPHYYSDFHSYLKKHHEFYLIVEAILFNILWLNKNLDQYRFRTFKLVKRIILILFRSICFHLCKTVKNDWIFIKMHDGKPLWGQNKIVNSYSTGLMVQLIKISGQFGAWTCHIQHTVQYRHSNQICINIAINSRIGSILYNVLRTHESYML